MEENIGYLEAKTCRLCANFYIALTEQNSNLTFVNLFEAIEGMEADFEFIQAELRAWQLKLAPNDGLPQLICADCFAQFQEINVFRQKCLSAQEKLVQAYLQECSEEQMQLHNVLDDDTAVASDLLPTVDAAEAAQMSANSLSDYFTEFTNFSSGVDELGNDLSIVKNESINFMPAQNLYYEQEPPISEVMGPKAEALASEMSPVVDQDLEDMLQGNIIPTKSNDIIKKVSEKEHEQQQQSQLQKMKQTLELKKAAANVSAPVPQTSRFDNAAYDNAKDDDDDDDNDSDDDDDDDIDASDVRLSGNPYACQYCYCAPTGSVDHLIFSDSEALSQHFFVVHDPNLPYTCPFCQETYKNAKLRDNHVRSIHIPGEVIEQCKYCKKKLRRSMEVHQYSCQFIDDWECAECGEKFIQVPLYRFRTHQRQHYPAKQFHCKVCNRVFVRRANMEAHERLHVQQAATLLICEECNGAFCGEYELKRHKYQAHNGDLPVNCDYCFKGFVSIAFLSRHLQHFHPEKLDANSLAAVTCTNCGTVFSSVHKLRYHTQRARDENGKCIDIVDSGKERRRQQRQGVFPCPYCAKRFHLKPQLQKHLNTHDARLRPYQCDQCNIRCRTSFELKQHVNVAHLKIKAFECTECGKSFGYKKDLRDHMLFHAEITVSCPELDCDYSCKNIKALNDHIRHKHRPIPCEYCGETFTRQRLTTHLRNVHRGEIDVEVNEETETKHMQTTNGNVSDNTLNDAADMNVINTMLVNNIGEAVSGIEANGEKVRVELLNGSVSPSILALQEQQALSTFKPLLTHNEHIEQYFMGSIMDPDHEIIVT